ncbi:MAG: hypothetical protein AMJ75_03765 [Phycisphaerae bacterium SM1_79]|nr:MAG: hypothetical protein AMJ75_03765 [Phycisphaerae bacterium SM1_79]
MVFPSQGDVFFVWRKSSKIENSLKNIFLIPALPRANTSLEIAKAAGGVALKYQIKDIYIRLGQESQRKI